MAKKNHTKKALISSLLALFICFTMLIGTTFAWFTDTAVSANNVIKSGNLDVVLEYKTDLNDKWTEVKEDTKIFNEDALYEPGYTEVVFLRISNAGSLALKAKLGINVAMETSSTNVNGEKFYLSDYLQIGAYPMAEYNGDHNYADTLLPLMFGSREDALKNVDLKKFSEFDGIVTEDIPILVGDKTAQVAALVLTMPETVGNEANHKTGEEAPEIQLGVTLQATQLTEEKDSFDNQYDKDATYADIPSAIVTGTGKRKINATLGLGGEAKEYELDTSYVFKPGNTLEEAKNSDYRYWHADFVVKADKDVPANSMALAGFYNEWCQYNNDNWVVLTSPEAITAGTEVRLVSTLGATVNYEELCDYGNKDYGSPELNGFQCGLADLTGANKGTTVTVELRLYETEEPSESNGNSTNKEVVPENYKVIGRYSYTF